MENNNIPEFQEVPVAAEQPVAQETVEQVEAPYIPPVEEEKKVSNTKAIISLVCGILSLICCCGFTLGLNLIPGIVAIILSLADKKARGQMSGLALAGLICGIIGTVISVGVLIYNIIYFILVGGFAFAEMASSSYYY